MKRSRGKIDMEALVRGRRPGRLIEPPRDVVARAVALGQGAERRPSGLAGWLHRLAFDSALTPAVAGVRGGPVEGERRLLYELDGGEVPRQLDVRLRHVSGTVEIVGQLLPPLDGAWVEFRLGRNRTKASLGSHGEFQASLAAGRGFLAVLSLRVDEQTLLVLDNLALPPKGRGDA